MEFWTSIKCIALLYFAVPTLSASIPMMNGLPARSIVNRAGTSTTNPTTTNSTTVTPSKVSSPNSPVTCLPNDLHLLRPNPNDCIALAESLSRDPATHESKLFVRRGVPHTPGPQVFEMPWNYQKRTCHLTITPGIGYNWDHTTLLSISDAIGSEVSECYSPEAPLIYYAAKVNGGLIGGLAFLLHGGKAVPPVSNGTIATQDEIY